MRLRGLTGSDVGAGHYCPTMPYDVVDSHLQVWDPEHVHYPWMDADHLPVARRLGDVGHDLHEHRVDGVVLVQSADNPADTEHLLFQALCSPRVVGVVGWVPLAHAADASARLDAWRFEPVVGVAHHAAGSGGWLLRPDVAEGLTLLTERRLPLDLPRTTPRMLDEVARVAERHPKLTLVLGHLASPPLAARAAGDTATWDAWVAGVHRVAQAQHVVAKVAGLGHAAGPGWTAADVRPAVDVALEAFGPERLMLGSDWPAALDGHATWSRTWQELCATLDGLDPAAQARLRGGTAVDVYGLPPVPVTP